MDQFIAIVILLIGYFLGRVSKGENSTNFVESIPNLGKTFKKIGHKIKISMDSEPSGVIYRPPSQVVNQIKRSRDQGEAGEALKETLDQIPELREAKRMLSERK